MEQKTNLPGIFLIIIGVLSILLALVNLASGLIQGPGGNPFAQQMGMQADPSQTVGFYLGLVVVVLIFLVTSVVVILAGVKMRALQSYNLVMAGTILAMVPCCTSWGCCLFATPVGIWALIVLMDPQVKASFR